MFDKDCVLNGINNLKSSQHFRESLNDYHLKLFSKETGEGEEWIYAGRVCLSDVRVVVVKYHKMKISEMIIDLRYDQMSPFCKEYFRWLCDESAFKVFKPYTVEVEDEGNIFLWINCRELNWNSLFTFLVSIRELTEASLFISNLQKLVEEEGASKEEAWIVSHLIWDNGGHSSISDVSPDVAKDFIKGDMKIDVKGKFLNIRGASFTPHVWKGDIWMNDTFAFYNRKSPKDAYAMFKDKMKEL